MPVQLSYPGVYVEEVPSGVRTITGVATSVTAFVGRASRDTTTDAGHRHQLRRLRATVRRPVEGQHASASRSGTSSSTAGRPPSSCGCTTRRRAAARSPRKASFSISTLDLEALDPGTWGNSLRARVDYVTRPVDPTLGETATSLFNLYVRDGTTGVVEEHRNVVVAPADHPRLVTRVLANDSRLVTATGMGANRPATSVDTVDAGKTVWDDNATATNAKVTASGQASDGLRR